jgi:hypothetical protein
MDEFRETTRRSWLDRLGGAFVGVVVGLLLFVIAFPLLWWNEGRAVDRSRTLEEGLGLVVPVAAERIDPAHEKGLIHIAGLATADAPLGDPLFGVSAEALKLERVVEMYQWVEEVEERTVKEVGGSERTEKTYRYKKEWRSGAVNSGGFRIPEGHANPGAMPVNNFDQVARRIAIGAFTLTRDFVGQIDAYQDLPVTPAMHAAAAADIRAAYRLAAGEFRSGDAAQPKVGDTRIRFRAIEPQEISVVGLQSGGRIEPYRTRTGEIALLRMGGASAQAMFADAEDENLIITWALRLGGFAAMWIGLALLFGPIRMLADVLPILGTIVGSGIAAVTGLAAFALSFVTVAVAWIAYRPLFALALLAVAGIVGFGAAYVVRARRRPVMVPPA